MNELLLTRCLGYLAILIIYLAHLHWAWILIALFTLFLLDMITND